MGKERCKSLVNVLYLTRGSQELRNVNKCEVQCRMHTCNGP